MSSTYTNVIVFAVGVVALYAGYTYLYGSETSDTIQVTAIAPEGSAEAELVGLLQKIESIRLDPTIFTDVVYLSLVDFAQTLTPEPVGRPNPFAPIGSRAVPTPPPAQGGVNNVFTR